MRYRMTFIVDDSDKKCDFLKKFMTLNQIQNDADHLGKSLANLFNKVSDESKADFHFDFEGADILED